MLEGGCSKYKWEILPILNQIFHLHLQEVFFSHKQMLAVCLLGGGGNISNKDLTQITQLIFMMV
jgi:hypothetical protein